MTKEEEQMTDNPLKSEPRVNGKLEDSSDDDKESRASRSSLTTSPVTILEGYPCNKDLEKDSHQCQVISTPYLPKKPGPIDDKLWTKGREIFEDKAGLEAWLKKFRDLKFEKEKSDESIGSIVGVIYEKAIQCQADPDISTDCAILMLDLYQSHPRARKVVLNQCVIEFNKRIKNEDKTESMKLPMSPPLLLKRPHILGTCQFFAELYQGVGILTPKIMIESVVMLLESRDEGSLEGLTILIRTIGQKLENEIGILCSSGVTTHPDGDWVPDRTFMDKAFTKLKEISIDPNISVPTQESLKNVISLRNRGWKPGIAVANKDTQIPMASSSASRNQPQKESFSDDDEDAGDFELIVTVKKVLLAFLRVKKVNLKFIQAKFPGKELIQFVEELACYVGEMEAEEQQIAAADIILNLMENKLITKIEVIQSLKLGVLMLHGMRSYTPPGVMAFATFLAQLFKHEKDLCWLVSMGELVKGKVTNVEWKDIVACTMYKLTLKVSVAEQFVENMLRNTPGASGLPIHVPSGTKKDVPKNAPGTSKSSAPSTSQAAAPEPPRIPYHPLAKPPRPPNWEASLDAAIRNLTPFVRVPVPSASHEHAVFSKLLEPYLNITKLDRIVNPELWRRFSNTRREMLSMKSDDMELLAALGLSETEILHRAHILTNWKKDRALRNSPYSDNMALLFHCTRTKQLDDIFSQGLDERLGGGGTFGKGIYFADNPTKSIAYDANSTLLVFAVILGDCVRSSKGALVREPPKVPSQQRCPTDLFFDSLIGGATMNEYVIFNRNQCCPLYAVTYAGTGGRYPGHIGNPPFVWNNTPPPPPLPVARDNVWPLYARTLFQGMENDELNSITMGNTSSYVTKRPPSKASITTMVTQLNNLGFLDDTLNLTLLEIYDYNLEETIDSLLEGAATAIPVTSSNPKGNVPIIGMKKNTGKGEEEPEDEECPICCTKFTPGALGAASIAGKTIKCGHCGHHVCSNCYSQICSTGTTMSGQQHTFMKCPFCLASTGLQIGSCPNGTMTVTEIRNAAAGYENYTTFCINYQVPTSPGLNRTAYVPNCPEGKKVVDLLRKAWDRRLCFSIGTSMTTGRKNVLVWNIHHKSALSGGVQAHGYPDPTYLTRVQEELAQYSLK